MNIRLEFSYPEDEDNLKKFVQAVGGREWVGLTDEERNTITRHHAYVDDIIKVTEAKLREKNT